MNRNSGNNNGMGPDKADRSGNSMTSSEQVSNTLARDASASQDRGYDSSLLLGDRIAECGLPKCTDFTEFMVTGAVRGIDAPLHRVIRAHLGEEYPEVVLHSSSQDVILNIDAMPEIPNPRLDDRVGRMLITAIMTSEFENGRRELLAGSHPLLSDDPRRIPSFLHKAAGWIPGLRGFATRYQRELMSTDGAPGLIANINRHSQSIFKALFTSSTPVEVISDQDFEIPTEDQRVLNLRCLEKFHLSMMTPNQPHATIAASFQSELTNALSVAIDQTCSELGLPEYKGDPWSCLAIRSIAQLSDAQKRLLKNFVIDDTPVVQWINESQSAFFRGCGEFWAELQDDLSGIIKAKMSTGESVIQFGVVGAGMNEEPLSLAMYVENFLDEEGLKGELDYRITVYSRDNLTIRTLAAAQDSGDHKALVYPESVVPRMQWRKYQFCFEPHPRGFVPRQDIFERMNFEILDLTEENEGLKQTHDMLLVHNVFQYITTEEARIAALKTIDSLTTEDTIVSIRGDHISALGPEEEALRKKFRG